MAIRRPGINSPTWLFQDFLYAEEIDQELRYIQVKWDGEIYGRTSESFDYSNPPFPNDEQRGGNIVAQLDYTLKGKIITINDWWVNWKDEWPLRLASNYLINCLYPPERGFFVQVCGSEVYNQAGEAIPVASKPAYPFWVSEQFFPVDNTPNDFLYH